MYILIDKKEIQESWVGAEEYGKDSPEIVMAWAAIVYVLGERSVYWFGPNLSTFLISSDDMNKSATKESRPSLYVT